MAAPAVPPQHLKWTRFCHASQLVLCLMWISACLLMYWHAPSFQVEQLYDCRWHLSCLLISAGFGLLFMKAPSSLLFAVTFVAAQYSVVYSFLSVVIYGVDCLMVLNGQPSVAATQLGVSTDFTAYLKLAVVVIVLSSFGLGISLVYVHRLYLIGWDMGPVRSMSHSRTIQVFSALHACFALFTMYVVEELTPFKTWFVRVYMVHEFSCSLLSLSLAVLQLTALVHSNSTMLKAIFIANLCQFVQELHIGTTAFYTAFYIRKVVVAVPTSDVIFRQVVIILNLIAHLARLGMCASTAWIVAPSVWTTELTFRVQRQVDQLRLTASQDYVVAVAKENRWLLYVAAWAVVIAVGHFALNTVYVILDSVMEALVIAAGTSFLFSLLVLGAIILYMKRRYRLALICCAYFTLNLFISASLLVASFIQDVIFGQTSPNPRYAFLYIADVALAFVTVFVSTRVLKFCTRTLLETYTLAKQPTHVQKAVKILRHIGLFSLLTVGIEFLLLLELRIEAMAAHLSMTSSIQDWLITAVQSVFLFWVTKHERYQCCMLILIFQLANVSLVSLDLLAQQTDLMQMLITLIFQHGEVSARAKAAMPSFPIDHFIVILVLHFLQVAQWFLSVFALGVSLYIIDNTVEDDSVKTNDNHEISVLGMDIGGAENGEQRPQLKAVPKGDDAAPISPRPHEPNGALSFDNALFNDPLAMSHLSRREPDNSPEMTEMDTVDVPLDGPTSRRS